MNQPEKPSAEQILNQLEIKELNPMQQAIAKVNSASGNILLLSPTGSGKTLAFLFRVLEQLDYSKAGAQALIIAPSRELVLQIETVFRSMKTGFKVCVCYGGHASRTEQNRLEESPALIIGTPGRLADHVQNGRIQPNTIELVVLDEFDKSLQMGFHEQLQVLFKALNGKQKHILTSATDLDEMPRFIPFRNPETLNFLIKNSDPKLSLTLIRTSAEDKTDSLLRLVAGFDSEISLVFCNHREAVERISGHFRQAGFAHGIFHGAMEQVDRERNLIKFRAGACHVLISTDLAARGLDIPEIRHVVHYQLPVHEDGFIHRNGRTARMHAEGQAYLIVADDEPVPSWLSKNISEMTLKPELRLPPQPEFECIYFSAGKKDKISKGDIAGLLMKKGGLSSDEIGLITITDSASYVAVRRNKVGKLLSLIKGEKLKKAKVKSEVAR